MPVSRYIENEETLFTLLGKRIMELRKKAGYTSYETFAFDVDIPTGLYWGYERGANLHIKSLYRILKFHKITFTEFFANDDFKNFNFESTNYLD